MLSISSRTFATAHQAHRQAPGKRLHSLEQGLLRHAELILCRASGIGLMIGLVVQPGRFPAAARTIGNAYAFRFWRPANFGELLDILVAILIWPFGIILCAAWFTSKNGAATANGFGRSIIRQIADQLKLAVTSGLPPPWYYVFELYRPGEIKRAPAYLTRAETKQGSNRLLAGARGSSSPLVDKEAFARFCNQRQLKTLRVLFSAHQGELRSSSSTRSLPRADLFFKPVCGCGGRGAERWDYAGDGSYRDVHGRRRSASELIEHLRRLSRHQPYLVQERARNHPAMRCLSNGALNTIRLISCLDEREQPELIGGVLRMAVGTNVTVDNVHAGGIAASVDLDEGRLDQATHMGMDARRGWIDRHPDTGALITGRLIPRWDEVRELVLRAHSAFNDWVVVGWDVAIMADGPCLVEGNNGPDVDLIQRPLRTAFGESRLGELIAFHLDRTEQVWRA
jgi:hypothetical protein